MAVDHLADAVRILGRNSSHAQRTALAQKRRSLGAALSKRAAPDRGGSQLATAIKTRAGSTTSSGTIPTGYGTAPYGLTGYGQ